MSKIVLRPISHVRLSLTILLGLLIGLALAGCGGGGGGNPGSNPITGIINDPNKAAVIGVVTDTTAAATPVANATVTIVGYPTLTTNTLANGTFTIQHVPPAATQFRVTAPSSGAYFNFAVYNGVEYDETSGPQCPLPLPTLAAGQTFSLPHTIQLFPAGQNPPPIPSTNGTGACP